MTMLASTFRDAGAWGPGVVMTMEFSFVKTICGDVAFRFDTFLFLLQRNFALNPHCNFSERKMNVQMKATEQNLPLILFIMLCKVVLTFESMDEILKCNYLSY